MQLNLSGMKNTGIIFLVIWVPYAYSFFPIEAITKLPVLSAYHFIMLAIAIIGASLLLNGNLVGLRVLFLSSLMYVFYDVCLL